MKVTERPEASCQTDYPQPLIATSYIVGLGSKEKISKIQIEEPGTN